MAVYGYLRVLSNEEVDEAAVLSITSAGCDYLFVDKVNKASDKRVEFDKMLRLLGEGDVVLLGELPSLFRSSSDLKTKVKSIIDCGANVKCLTSPWLDTVANPAIALVFDGMLEFEKELLAERIRTGMEVAKSKGVELGRPTADTSKLEHAVALYETGNYSVPEICRICDVSKSTLYRELRKQHKVRATQ